MILRLRQTSSACLRCQMRMSGLLGGAGSRSRALAPLSQPSLRALRARRAYSTFPNETNENEPLPERTESTDSPDAASIENTHLVRWKNERDKTGSGRGGRRAGAYLPEDEWTRRRHLNRANLKEKSAPVNVDSLGRPSNIVVLRDHVGGKSPRYVRDKGPEVVIEHEPVDLLEVMKGDIGIAGAAEVIENIASLRPAEHKKRSGKGRTYAQTWEEITNLEKNLTQGFAKKQLMAYIQDFEAKKQKLAAAEKEKEKDEEDEVDEEDNGSLQVADWLSAKETQLAAAGEEITPRILSETRWMPGRSQHGDYFENSLLRGYTSDAARAKSKVAMFIIRSCWRIRAKEYDSAVGEIEVKLAPEDLELLIAPWSSNPPLKKISDALVTTENEKIEAYRARDVVRITGTPTQANRIARAIENVLTNIRTYKVSLKELKRNRREFNTAVYKELERLTNSEVTRMSRDLIIIKGMNMKPGSGLSTMADVARRVLLSSSDAADQTTRNVGYKITDKPTYAVKWPLQAGMSWRNKMRHWARWESPIEKPVEKPVDLKEYIMELDEVAATEEASPKPEIAAIEAPPKDELIVAAVPESETPSSTANYMEGALWQPKPQKSYAVIGNLLHEQDVQRAVDQKPVSFNMRDISESRTLFVSHTRNLARLVDHLPTFPSRRRVYLKFLPSPWTKRGGEALNVLPAVEMEFRNLTKEDVPLLLQSIYAISDDVHNDVMIPDKTQDLSFRQRTTFEISSKEAMGVPQIADFLSRSKLNPKQGEVLTPAELMLPIPSYICRNPGEIFGNGKSLDVPYLFAGLEFRESATFDYHNWLLRYRTINGGKATGQYSELSLEYQRTPGAKNETPDTSSAAASEAEADNDEVLKNFTAAAFRLVDDLDTPRPVRVRSVEDSTTADDAAPITYKYLPSVRRCMIKTDVSMPQQFTCFNHRPLLKFAEEQRDEEEEERKKEEEESKSRRFERSLSLEEKRAIGYM